MVQKIQAFLGTELFAVVFASLPLFFSWYPVLFWKSENPVVKKYCLYSATNSIYFFLGFIGTWVLSKIPFLGDFLPFLVHFGLVIIYIGISLFLIYTYIKKKSMTLSFLEEHSRILSQKLES